MIRVSVDIIEIIYTNEFWNPPCIVHVKELELVLVTGVLFSAGPQVHHGLHGRKLCRRGHPGLGKDVGGI